MNGSNRLSIKIMHRYVYIEPMEKLLKRAQYYELSQEQLSSSLFSCILNERRTRDNGVTNLTN